MKILFYSSYHFNTETFGPYLENMQKHINNGDEVYFLSCNSELTSCQVNPEHKTLKCFACKNFKKNALSCIDGPFTELTINDILKLKDVNLHHDLINLNSIEALKNIEYEGFDIGMSVTSSLVSIYRDPELNLKDIKELVLNQWDSSIWIYEAIKKAIRKYEFETVYVFNARFATLRACLRASQHLNVQCNVLEEGRDRESYSIFPNVMPHSISYYEELTRKSWEDETTDKISIAENYLKKRRESKNERVGFFTKNQTQGLLPNSFNRDKKNIAIFTSSEDEFVAIGSEWENHLYKTQVEGVKKIASSLLNEIDYKIYVRIHPNLSGMINNSITELLDLNYPNLEVIKPTSEISSYELMIQSDKIITFGSSMGIEAPAVGKVSLLAGKSLYMNLESTYNPQSHEELLNLILDDSLEPKPKLGSLMYAYMLTKFGYNYKYFKREDYQTGFLNNKKFCLSPAYRVLRTLGRKLRLANENKAKKLNNNKVENYN